MSLLELWRDGRFIDAEQLSEGERAEWERYASTHEWLLNADYMGTLRMFLSHLRRGINLNE